MNLRHYKRYEWLHTVDDSGEERMFKVPSHWLHQLLKGWAEIDAETVIVDKERYIQGRTEHLYEHTRDVNFSRSIYEAACESKKVLATQ